MISSSIIGALEKLVLVANYYDEALRMTCDVHEISQQVRTVLVTVDKVMIDLDDIDDASVANVKAPANSNAGVA